MQITIHLLKDCPEHIPALTDIWFQLLGRFDAETTADGMQNILSTYLHDDRLPLAFVALCDGKPVGMCRLRADGELHPECSPRISSLVVAPAYQQHGIGRMLMDATVAKARELGFKKIYLFVVEPLVFAWYVRLGWQKIGEDAYNNLIVTRMSLDLA